MNLQLPVPRHLRSPGDDGYRTPTIEDTERDFTVPENALCQCPSSAGTDVRDAHTSALENVHRASYRKPDGDMDGATLPHSESGYSAKKLTWKKRIRHFTWAFFTLTMATGGIANVIYNSTLNLPTRPD